MIENTNNDSFSQEDIKAIFTIYEIINASCKRKFEELKNPNKDKNTKPPLKKRKITKKIEKPKVILLQLLKKLNLPKNTQNQ